MRGESEGGREEGCGERERERMSCCKRERECVCELLHEREIYIYTHTYIERERERVAAAAAAAARERESVFFCSVSLSILTRCPPALTSGPSAWTNMAVFPIWEFHELALQEMSWVSWRSVFGYGADG